MDRVSIVTAWYQATHSPCLVATSALSAGLDYPSVRRVVHVDAPSGLVDYGQETGRAGRDGLHAICLTLLPPKWCINWDRRYRSDFLQEDCAQMEAFLKSSHCLRQKLTSYLDGSMGGRYGVTCNQADGIQRAACSICSLTPSSLMTQPEPLRMQSPDEKAGSISHESSSLASDSSDGEIASQANEDAVEERVATTPYRPSSSSSSSSGSLSKKETAIEVDTWSVADCMQRHTTMLNAEAQTLYEQRLSIWGRACILCSFRSRRQTSFPHRDCMQAEYSHSLTDFRRSIRFERGIGCFGCGQPMVICQRKGRGGCQYPWFIWHCCWVAVHEDRLYTLELLQALGCPDLSLHAAPEKHPVYLRWLGGSFLVFGSVRGSNALRLASIWIDRLNGLCT